MKRKQTTILFLCIQMTAEWEDDVLVIHMVPVSGNQGKPHTISREVVDGELITVSMHCGDCSTLLC